MATVPTRSPRQDSSSPIIENGSPTDEEVKIRMTDREKRSLCHSVNYERLMNLRHHKAVTLKQKYKKKEQLMLASEVAVEDEELIMSRFGSKASLLAAEEAVERPEDFKVSPGKSKKDLNIHMFEHYILKKKNLKGTLLRG